MKMNLYRQTSNAICFTFGLRWARACNSTFRPLSLFAKISSPPVPGKGFGALLVCGQHVRHWMIHHIHRILPASRKPAQEKPRRLPGRLRQCGHAAGCESQRRRRRGCSPSGSRCERERRRHRRLCLRAPESPVTFFASIPRTTLRTSRPRPQGKIARRWFHAGGCTFHGCRGLR